MNISSRSKRYNQPAHMHMRIHVLFLLTQRVPH